MITDPNTGEVIDSIGQARSLWQEATTHEKEAKRIKEALKEYVTKEVELNGGAIQFDDGYQFKQVNSQSFAVDPVEAKDILPRGAFYKCLKPDAVDLKVVADLVEAGEISQNDYANLMDAKVAFRAKSYIRLERT